jgi:hypothetical protein
MLKEKEWDSIVDNIESGKTIVCLGAEIFNDGDKSLDQQLALEVADLDNVGMYGDGLFHLKGSGISTTYTAIKKYLNRDFPHVNAICEILVKMPISVILSTNPDQHLKKTFDRLGHSCTYAYHHAHKPAKELPDPNSSNPLIYNLFGDIQFPESMILTHENVFNFVESAVNGKSIPQVVQERIADAQNFLFIGLPFNKWYMKLLLHILRKYNNREVLRLAANQAFDQEVQKFCHQQFEIVCVPVKTLDFVSTLQEKCQKANLVRQQESAGPTTLFDRWMQLLRNDEQNELLNQMLDYFDRHLPDDRESSDLLNNLTGRLARLERKVMNGTIKYDDEELERNQIREAINHFLNETVKTL